MKLCLYLGMIFILFSIPAVSRAQNGLWIYGGLDAGYSRVTTDLSTEADKDGFHFQVKLLPSYAWDHAYVDLGLGWFHSNLFGSSGAIDRDDITTWAWFAETSARYRITEGWSVGPVATLYFGTDLSFASKKKGDSSAFFAGLAAAYDIPLTRRSNLRFLGQATTDLTIEDRQVYLGLLGIQIGFSAYDAGEGTRFLESRALEAKREAEPKVPQDIQVKVEGASELAKSGPYQVGSGASSFEINKAELSLEARQALVRFGEALSAKPTEWDKIVVEGHTDVTGAEAFNEELSERRAAAVARAISAGGVDPNRIETRGFGSRRPLDLKDTEEAHRRNRRVEIRVMGSKPSAATKKPVR